jgi:cysteine synthase
MPDDVALEKVRTLEALGADVERVRPASIVDKKQASLLAITTGGVANESSSLQYVVGAQWPPDGEKIAHYLCLESCTGVCA